MLWNLQTKLFHNDIPLGLLVVTPLFYLNGRYIFILWVDSGCTKEPQETNSYFTKLQITEPNQTLKEKCIKGAKIAAKNTKREPVSS